MSRTVKYSEWDCLRSLRVENNSNYLETVISISMGFCSVLSITNISDYLLIFLKPFNTVPSVIELLDIIIFSV